MRRGGREGACKVAAEDVVFIPLALFHLSSPLLHLSLSSSSTSLLLSSFPSLHLSSLHLSSLHLSSLPGGSTRMWKSKCTTTTLQQSTISNTSWDESGMCTLYMYMNAWTCVHVVYVLYGQANNGCMSQMEQYEPDGCMSPLTPIPLCVSQVQKQCKNCNDTIHDVM